MELCEAGFFVGACDCKKDGALAGNGTPDRLNEMSGNYEVNLRNEMKAGAPKLIT